MDKADQAALKRLQSGNWDVEMQQRAWDNGLHAGMMVPLFTIGMSCAAGYFSDKFLDSVAEFENSQDGPRTTSYINSWYSTKLQAHVIIYKVLATGKIKHMVRRIDSEVVEFIIQTAQVAATTYKVEHEMKAMTKLKTHVSKSQFCSYLTTGAFFEISKRSGVCYIFRRCRPTIACRLEPKGWRYLAALCTHPVGYYKGTWCGGLVPSDDVIAHLMMMRADEWKFWSKSNQHASLPPQANI